MMTNNFRLKSTGRTGFQAPPDCCRPGFSSGRAGFCALIPALRGLSRKAGPALGALLLTLCLAAVAAAEGEGPLPDAILYPGDKAGHILVVDKENQMLYLYRHDGQGEVALERVMSCSTGERKGDKMVEGDKKTPNGFYIFNQKLLPRELSPIYGTLAYPTDYPNFWDKKLGRGGHGIWIHGINKPLVDYDSNGCVELENADIARMEELIHLHDTPLLTYESLSLAPVDELKQEGATVRNFIERWRRAWAEKDHAAYKSFYDPNFVNSDGRSFSGWMTHKENVARNYQTITVEVKDLQIYRHRDVIVAVFEQDYRGDGRFTSVGLKRLYIQKDAAGNYKILAEEFKPLPQRDSKKWLTAAEKKRALETPPLMVAKAEDKTPLPSESSRTSVEVRSLAETLAKDAAARQPRSDDWDADEEPAAPGSAELSRQEAAARAKAAAEASARATAEAKAKAEADSRARAEARRQAETQAAEARAREEAEARDKEAAAAKAAAEAQAQAEAKAAEDRAEARAREAAVREAAESAVDEELKKSLIDLVRQWARLWSDQEAEAYLDLYHPDFYFKSKNMRLAAFKRYKRMLFENTGIIEVEVSDFDVTKEAGGQVRVSFRQNYRSDNVRDLGRKTLTFKQSDGSWKILAETWRAL